MNVRVQHEDFDVGAEIAALHAGNPAVGAVAVFVGLVRDINERRDVAAMTLEHYPGMTEHAIEAIVEEAHARWRLDAVRVVHRVGSLAPTDRIVMVAVASAHRGDAFAACEYIMDFLKTRAPIWKKETTLDGERWVEARASDDEATARWQATEDGTDAP